MPADSSQPADNHRVTLALLGQKVDQGNADLAEVKAELKELRAEIKPMASWCTESKTRWAKHDKEDEDQEQRIRVLEKKQGWEIWRDIGAALSGIAAGIVTGLTGKP